MRQAGLSFLALESTTSPGVVSAQSLLVMPILGRDLATNSSMPLSVTEASTIPVESGGLCSKGTREKQSWQQDVYSQSTWW
jgi:hypothetical protein